MEDVEDVKVDSIHKDECGVVNEVSKSRWSRSHSTCYRGNRMHHYQGTCSMKAS